MSDPHHLERFVQAQDSVIDEVRDELRRGRKESHWMWFIFPQIAGLGSSSMAREFAIGSRAEAEAYLAHPVLGPRLVECTELVNQVEARPVEQIFDPIDTLKFRSSMTLFAEVGPAGSVFTKALEKFFDGRPDRLTIERLLRR